MKWACVVTLILILLLPIMVVVHDAGVPTKELQISSENGDIDIELSSEVTHITRSTANFTQPVPDSESWQTSLTVECGIIIQDLGGSGVDSSTIRYRYVEYGEITEGIWQIYSGASMDAESIICRQDITFDTDGVHKKVQWKAKTVSGKDLIDQGYYTVKIDSTPATIDSFSLDFIAWHRVNSPEISFYINDTDPPGDYSSGVNINTLRYQLTTTGLDNYGSWLPLVPLGSGKSVKCIIKPIFEEC